ncbi:hypothetical protein FHS21_003707 [Phyllobacterium trifolii]|uniref:Uncharacterized protein n=1 Tax=Phyllobacterium trifolii TaxID=300193 RepID=A0A839UF13_9HYPH|nr:hypothetical protein [Phyllobacterium trifolii]
MSKEHGYPLASIRGKPMQREESGKVISQMVLAATSSLHVNRPTGSATVSSIRASQQIVISLSHPGPT